MIVLTYPNMENYTSLSSDAITGSPWTEFSLTAMIKAVLQLPLEPVISTIRNNNSQIN
jgi:hypothetical protein